MTKQMRVTLTDKLMKLVTVMMGSFVFLSDKKEYIFSNVKGAVQMTAGNIGSDKTKVYAYGNDVDTLEKSIVHKLGYCVSLTIKDKDGKVTETVDLKVKAVKAPKVPTEAKAKRPAKVKKNAPDQELVTA